MSIIRAPRPEANFYMLNKAISEDARLSWAARGLLVFLLGKPDNWAVSVTHLRNETSKSSKPTGRDGVYGLLQELISAGYVERRQERGESGLLGETNYVVSETPLPALPYPVEPLPAQPYPANPTLVSIEGKQVLKKPARTEKPSCNSGWVGEGFEQFWKLYPRKVGKDKAEKAWARIKPAQALFDEIIAALAKHSTSHDWTKDNGQFIPHASTWLNGKRWRDVLQSAAGAGSAYTNLPQHTDDMYPEVPDGVPNF
ncbi:hypothetical protein [Pseudomonas qingdaonensis]|uniref:hypothetical protein n=1 Tax=Pseudomonas qingdaonensis TaxID=2056231 RepID=UPI001F0B8EF2|nr:hypothetical protein [Pseudomonas qingdaonensis]